jgi:hypothetical protein
MPVLTEGWYVDGVSVEEYGAVLETRDGWDDVPAMRGSNAVLLGRHGTSWRRKRYEPGVKSLTVGVHGADTSTWAAPATGAAQRALYERNLDSLLRMFAPRHRLLDVVRVHADGSKRHADCEVTSAFAPSVQGQSYGQVSIELGVPGTFWEDADATSHRLSYDVAAGGEQAVEAFSFSGQTGYCTDATVVVTGPCSTVSVYDTETGSGFAYPSAIGAGQTLTVDSGAFTAVLDDGTPASVLTDLTLTSSPVLLEISPAPFSYRGPTLTVTTTGAGSGFAVVVTGRRKWLR